MCHTVLPTAYFIIAYLKKAAALRRAATASITPSIMKNRKSYVSKFTFFINNIVCEKFSTPQYFPLKK